MHLTLIVQPPPTNPPLIDYVQRLLFTPLIHSVFPPNLWFVVRWLKEQDDLFDVLSVKDVSVEGQKVYGRGSEGQGKYRSDIYPVQIIAKGEFRNACMLCVGTFNCKVASV